MKNRDDLLPFAVYVVRLTPPGRSAVASLMICGDRATDILKKCVTLSGKAEKDNDLFDERLFPPQTPLFGRFHLLDDLAERSSSCEEVVLFVRQPDSCELHCHGGDAAVAAIEKTLVALGCVRLGWNDWLQQLMANDETSPDVVSLEALQWLACAETEFIAKLLLTQYHGALSEKINRWTQEQQRWQQKIASGEVVVSDAGLSETISEIETLLDSYRFGKHLVSPFRVALVGAVNSGKSTLMNAIVGYQRSIISPVSGTTRDLVSAKTTIDGWQVMLIDTAGLRETDHPVEREGIRQTARMIDEADLVLHVSDASAGLPKILETVDSMHRSKTLEVFNKCDLVASSDEAPCCFVSALTGEGIPELLRQIKTRLIPEDFTCFQAVVFTERQVRLLEHLRDWFERMASSK